MFEESRMIATTDTVAVWLTDGTPDRLVWNGNRYRVSDHPTPLEDEFYWVTHPPVGIVGWRFQGTAEDGTTRMFDIRQNGDGWTLVRIYV